MERLITCGSAFLSLLGSCAVIHTWKNVEIPNYVSRWIIIQLSVAGVGVSVGFLMTLFIDTSIPLVQRSKILCYTQAFTLEFFYLALYLWTTCFALHLYQIIVKRSDRPQRFLRIYSCIGWGIPLLFLCFLVIRPATGLLGTGISDEPWCWLNNHSSDGKWSSVGAWQQFGYFYLPVSAILMFNTTVYLIMIRHMPKHDIMTARVRTRLLLYFAAFVFCACWGFANRMIQIFRSTHVSSPFLDFMESAFDPLQPFLNAVVYATNRQMLAVYRRVHCCSYCLAGETSDTESNATESLIDDSEPSDDELSDTLYQRGDLGDAASTLDSGYRSPSVSSVRQHLRSSLLKPTGTEILP